MEFNIIDHCFVDHAMYGARLAMNSEDKMDSTNYCIGDNDLELAKKLLLAGENGNRAHTKFLRAIPVVCLIKAPMYWWKEMDTYKVCTVVQSRSTMHKVMSRPLTEDDFQPDEFDVDDGAWTQGYIEIANQLIEAYKESESAEEKKAIKYWVVKKMPMEYLQERMVTLNAEVLYQIVLQRKNHQLKLEWQTEVCDKIIDWFLKYLRLNPVEYMR